MLPDRSVFVAWCEQEFAKAPTIKAFWDLIDKVRTRRANMLQEGNIEAASRITEAVTAAYRRLGGAK
jgi:hypothetical protein